jgi:hypothetical protein
MISRCQRSRVSGWMRSSASRQARTRPASSTRSARSARVTAGRLALRRRTSSCWRRSAFSASSCARLRSRSPPSLPRASRPLVAPGGRCGGRAARQRGCRSTDGGTHAQTTALRCSIAPRINPTNGTAAPLGRDSSRRRGDHHRGLRAREQPG